MKTIKFNCPTCKSIKTILVELEITASNLTIDITDCEKCKTKHTFKDGTDELIKYEPLENIDGSIR